jgi:ATP-dependent RNA helicase DDX41
MVDALSRKDQRPAPSKSLEEERDDYELPADYKPYVPVAKRRAQLLKTLSNRGAKRIKTSEDEPSAPTSEADLLDADEQAGELARRERTLLQAAIDMRERKQVEEEGKTKAELAAVEDEKMLVEMERGQKKLAGAKDIAEGKVWTESLKTSWRPPAFIRDKSNEEKQRLREKNHIIVEGEDIPPAIENFTVSAHHS